MKTEEIKKYKNYARILKHLRYSYEESKKIAPYSENGFRFDDDFDIESVFDCVISLKCFGGLFLEDKKIGGTLARIDAPFGRVLLLKALNKNLDNIINDMAAAAEEISISLIEEAKKENELQKEEIAKLE